MSESSSSPHSLVTGGDGFLGKHLCRALLALGHRVTVVDNHSSSRPVVVDDGVLRFEADIQTFDLRQIRRPDYIYHLASVAHPQRFASSRRTLFETNVVATDRLIDCAAEHGARLIFASTSEVYGVAEDARRNRRGIHENDLCVRRLLDSRSIYPTVKGVGEELIATGRARGVDCGSIRPFNIYGGQMDEAMGASARVIPRFFRCIQEGNPLPIHGDGSQVRSFMWVEDFVAALIALSIEVDELPPVVNIGLDEPVTVRQLAEYVCQITRTEPAFQWLPPREGEPDWRRPDCALLESLTDVKPTVALREGIQRLWDGRRLVNLATSRAC